MLPTSLSQQNKSRFPFKNRHVGLLIGPIPEDSLTLKKHGGCNRRSHLQRMGLNLDTATKVTNVNRQNLSLLEDFLQLKDKDIETLCRVIHWPGGVNTAEAKLWGCMFWL